MQKIILPREYNYIGIFLTFACTLKCSYCLNDVNYIKPQYQSMTNKQWVTGLKRIPATKDMPLTLQGGEPTCHPGFYDIVNNVNKPMDLLTNLQFNVDEWIQRVPVDKFKRNAPYASIRVSYHPETMDLYETLNKAKRLQDYGYQVGVYLVRHPEYLWMIDSIQRLARKLKLDFRTKEFLGFYDNKLYGTYKYYGAVGNAHLTNCLCRTTELLVAPNGSIHRCHSDMYNNRLPVGHMLNDYYPKYNYIPCMFYGNCNPCDVKITTNRYQVEGHTSVEIRDNAQ